MTSSSTKTRKLQYGHQLRPPAIRSRSQKMLTIFRTVHNFIYASEKNGRTLIDSPWLTTCRASAFRPERTVTAQADNIRYRPEAVIAREAIGVCFRLEAVVRCAQLD